MASDQTSDRRSEATAEEEAARMSEPARSVGPAAAPVYVRVTDGVAVEVQPMFLASQSFPDLAHFVWAYRVTIHNRRDDAVRLRDRCWRITDKSGARREVRGEGVVGETPLIQPSASYVYTSSVPLPTPSGVMGGAYGMEAGDGARFDVEIPTFSLDSPHDRRTLN